MNAFSMLSYVRPYSFVNRTFFNRFFGNCFFFNLCFYISRLATLTNQPRGVDGERSAWKLMGLDSRSMGTFNGNKCNRVYPFNKYKTVDLNFAYGSAWVWFCNETPLGKHERWNRNSSYFKFKLEINTESSDSVTF